MNKQHPRDEKLGACSKERVADSSTPRKPFKAPELQECGSVAHLTGERVFNFS